MKSKFLLILLVVLFSTVKSNAQFKNYIVKGGIQYQQVFPLSEYGAAYSFLGRGFLNFEISNSVAFEIGAGYGQYNTVDNFNMYPTPDTLNHDVKTDIIPIDVRLKISPMPGKNWNPYFYIGVGVEHFKVNQKPDLNIPEYGEFDNGWTAIIPIGIGTEVKLSDNVLMDISGGATYPFSDKLNNFALESFNDASANIGIGLTFAGSDKCNTDEDKDGLTYCREEQLNTDPENPDTDGDGCKDGEEVDTYKTNPLNKDTDGDTLGDCDEIKNYNTNPLDKDTDADGLMDNEELNKYMTLPTNKDTDGDGLTDGDEVLKYRTDPKLADTDLGSINDGVEVNRGTNPLNPDDDLPKAPVEEAPKVGTVIILEGINFASGSSEISSGSEVVLEKALSTMKNSPEIFVEISGHTDSRSNYAYNMQLSKDRAESVKAWLVSNGIDGIRIETLGFGPDQPVASNDTEEGMLKNRRIEFKRTK